MNNTARPTNGVKVNIGGSEFTLRYPLAAMREAASRFGGSITQLSVIQAIPVEEFGELLLFGLRANHPDLTLDQLNDLIDPTQVKELFAKYCEAMGAALPVPDPNAESPADLLKQLQDLMTRAEALTAKVSTSTGLASGQSDDTTSDSANSSSGA